jgi:hypothetical protein
LPYVGLDHQQRKHKLSVYFHVYERYALPIMQNLVELKA